MSLPLKISKLVNNLCDSNLQLTEVVKDVKYIQAHGHINIPPAAVTFYEKRDMFTEVRKEPPTFYLLTYIYIHFLQFKCFLWEGCLKYLGDINVFVFLI